MKPLEKIMDDDWLKLDDESRNNHIERAALLLITSGLFKGPLLAAKNRVVDLYTVNYLKRNLGDDWEERFNKNHGESAADLMIIHLSQAIAEGNKEDLKQIAKYLNDEKLCEEKPHEIFGLLGSARNSNERQKFIASTSNTNLIFQKTGNVLMRAAKVGAFALFVAIALPHVLPGVAGIGVIHLVGSTELINSGLKVSDIAIRYDQKENRELKGLEEHNQTMITPLGNKYRGPATSNQEEMDKRGRDSFKEMRTALRSMEQEDRQQIIGLSLIHLRAFIDGYEDIKKEKPEASPKEHFNRVMKKYAVVFKDEIDFSHQYIAQNVFDASVAVASDLTGLSEAGKFMGDILNDTIQDKMDDMDAPIVVKAGNHLASLTEKMVGYANLPPDYSKAGQVPNITFTASRIGKKKLPEQKSPKITTHRKV